MLDNFYGVIVNLEMVYSNSLITQSVFFTY